MLHKFLAPECIFGIGSIRIAGQYAMKYGATKVLVVTDPGIIKAGWTTCVTDSLEAQALSYVVFSGVTPNPRADEVMTGKRVYLENQCDLIIAVGGGSVIDCAKGIGIVCSNEGSILDFVGVDRIVNPMPPLICIPTTGGTSADVSQFDIITDMKNRVKLAIVSKAVVPDLSLIDPQTLTTMDPYLAACTGIDALVHAIEAFVSLAHTPLTDLHALQAIRLIAENIESSVADNTNVNLKEKIMLASFHAGLAFSNASLGGTHATSHSLGGLLDKPHGECNAILLRHVIEFNYATADERFQQICEAMGVNTVGAAPSERKRALLRRIETMLRNVNIVRTLGELGVSRTDIPMLSTNAMHDVCMATNPRRPIKRDIEVIYEEAL